MIVLRNEMGITKQVKVGFSWTMLLFGVFVPLYRGDIKWFLITLFVGFLTVGISWWIFPFFYNKVYYEDLLSKGYKVVH